MRGIIGRRGEFQDMKLRVDSRMGDDEVDSLFLEEKEERGHSRESTVSAVLRYGSHALCPTRAGENLPRYSSALRSRRCLLDHPC